MSQNNQQQKIRIPDEVKGFMKANFKKYKKKNKEYFDSKKELKDSYYSALMFDLQDVIEFLLKKGHIQTDEMQNCKKACYEKLAGEDGPTFIKYITKYIKKNGTEDIVNIEYLPIILYEIIADINKYNTAAKEQDPEAAVFDPSDLYELSNILLKKKLKKAVKKGIDENVAFDVLSVIPVNDAMKFSPYFRIKSVFELLYAHAETKNIDFDKVIKLLIDDEYYDVVISFALQERKEKIQKFNESQKLLFNNINDWIFNQLEDSDKSTIENIIKTYVKTRKRDEAAGKDGNRRYFIASLPETAYPRICKVVEKIIAEDESAKKYL